MKKFWDKIWDIVPLVWSVLWLLIITFGSVALLIVFVKLLLSLVGVM